MKTAVAVVSILAVLAAGAWAKGGGGDEGKARAENKVSSGFEQFMAMDTDASGVVSNEELLAFAKKIDTNADGSISKDEWLASLPAQPAAKEEKAKKGQGGKK